MVVKLILAVEKHHRQKAISNIIKHHELLETSLKTSLTLRVGFRRTILRAAGTTIRFLCGTQSDEKTRTQGQFLTPVEEKSQTVSCILTWLKQGRKMHHWQFSSVEKLSWLNLPCHKEEGCHQRPSACPERPDLSWFYVEAYLFKKISI